MKKLLLLLIPLFAITGIMNARNEGYNWYFGIMPTTLNAGQYYDLAFVRDSVTKNISYYQDGVFADFFNDATDALLPLVPNANTITFLKMISIILKKEMAQPGQNKCLQQNTFSH